MSKVHQHSRRRPASFRPVVECLEDRTLLAFSSLVTPGADGRLAYRPDAQGDVIPDFANVGYRSGIVPLPNTTGGVSVPTRVTVVPGPGDDGAAIQAALNEVAGMPLDANGYRGAVQLQAGEYQIAGQLQIRASGVVLRGAGTDLSTGTRLRATGTSQRTLIQVQGSGSRQEVSGTRHRLTDTTVPVGARSFTVDSTAGLSVGDTVIIVRPSTDAWIRAIHMDQLQNPWRPGSQNLTFDRVITAVQGNRITVDAPLTNAFEQRYGGGTIARYTWSGRIQNVGIANLRGISDYRSATDEAHSWRFIGLAVVQHAWVRNIVGQHFAYAAVTVASNAKWITVEDAQSLDPISQITGGRRYSFNVDGQLVLVRNAYARNGRHDFVNGGTVEGPNVFVDCRADSAHSDTGPHHNWAAGTLFDNVVVNGNQINVQNRGNSGIAHGWAGANMVVWNATASGGFVVQNPPTAQNWLIGSTGPIRQGSMYVGPRPAPGVTESHGTRVQPRSLYYAQLGQRLAGSLPTPWTQLYPEADAYVRDGSYADRNFGRETTLAAKNDLANYRSESYVRFNLAGMAGRRVLAANVRLVVGTVGAPVETAVAYVSNNSWSETDITWNNKPGSEQRSLGTRLAVRAGQAVEFGVTHLVQAAINGNRPLSLRFHSPMNIGSQGWVNYGSREGASAVRPQLRIAFAPTGGPDSAGQGPEDVRPGEEEAAPSPAPLEEDEGAGIAAPESTRADALTVQAVAGTTPGRDVAATVTLGWVVPGRNGLAEGKDESGVRAAVSAGCIPGGFESPGDAGFEPGRSRSEARVSVADGSCLSAGSEWETLLPLLGELPPF